MCSSERSGLGKSDVLRGEHLQLNEDTITFGLLYDYSKLCIVTRVAVIPSGDRATVETRRIPNVVVDTLDFLCAVPMTSCPVERAKRASSLTCMQRHAFHLVVHYWCVSPPQTLFQNEVIRLSGTRARPPRTDMSEHPYLYGERAPLRPLMVAERLIIT